MEPEHPDVRAFLDYLKPRLLDRHELDMGEGKDLVRFIDAVYTEYVRKNAPSGPPRLRLSHECRSKACQNPDCALCLHTLVKQCSRDIKKRYLNSEQILTRCGAPVTCTLENAPPNLQVSAFLVYLVDAIEYDKLRAKLDAPPRFREILDAQKPILFNKAPFYKLSTHYVRVPLEAGARSALIGDPDRNPVVVTKSTQTGLTQGKDGKGRFRLLVVAQCVLVASRMRQDAAPGETELDEVLPAVSDEFMVGTAGQRDEPITMDSDIDKLNGIGTELSKMMKGLMSWAAKPGHESLTEPLQRLMPKGENGGPPLRGVSKVGEFRNFVSELDKDVQLKEQFMRLSRFTVKIMDSAVEHCRQAVNKDYHARSFHRATDDWRVVFPAKDGTVLYDKPLGYVGPPGTDVALPADSPDIMQQPVFTTTLIEDAKAAWAQPGHPGWIIDPSLGKRFGYETTSPPPPPDVHPTPPTRLVLPSAHPGPDTSQALAPLPPSWPLQLTIPVSSSADTLPTPFSDPGNFPSSHSSPDSPFMLQQPPTFGADPAISNSTQPNDMETDSAAHLPSGLRTQQLDHLGSPHSHPIPGLPETSFSLDSPDSSHNPQQYDQQPYPLHPLRPSFIGPSHFPQDLPQSPTPSSVPPAVTGAQYDHTHAAAQYPRQYSDTYGRGMVTGGRHNSNNAQPTHTPHIPYSLSDFAPQSFIFRSTNHAGNTSDMTFPLPTASSAPPLSPGGFFPMSPPTHPHGMHHMPRPTVSGWGQDIDQLQSPSATALTSVHAHLPTMSSSQTSALPLRLHSADRDRDRDSNGYGGSARASRQPCCMPSGARGSESYCRQLPECSSVQQQLLVPPTSSGPYMSSELRDYPQQQQQQQQQQQPSFMSLFKPQQQATREERATSHTQQSQQQQQQQQLLQDHLSTSQFQHAAAAAAVIPEGQRAQLLPQQGQQQRAHGSHEDSHDAHHAFTHRHQGGLPQHLLAAQQQLEMTTTTTTTLQPLQQQQQLQLFGSDKTLELSKLQPLQQPLQPQYLQQHQHHHQQQQQVDEHLLQPLPPSNAPPPPSLPALFLQAPPLPLSSLEPPASGAELGGLSHYDPSDPLNAVSFSTSFNPLTLLNSNSLNRVNLDQLLLGSRSLNPPSDNFDDALPESDNDDTYLHTPSLPALNSIVLPTLSQLNTYPPATLITNGGAAGGRVGQPPPRSFSMPEASGEGRRRHVRQASIDSPYESPFCHGAPAGVEETAPASSPLSFSFDMSSMSLSDRNSSGPCSDTKAAGDSGSRGNDHSLEVGATHTEAYTRTPKQKRSQPDSGHVGETGSLVIFKPAIKHAHSERTDDLDHLVDQLD